MSSSFFASSDSPERYCDSILTISLTFSFAAFVRSPSLGTFPVEVPNSWKYA